MKVENTLSGQNKEALSIFRDKGDRREPFMFVGREEIFEDVERQLHETREAGRSLPNMRVIQGPPGSGKTSILRELESHFKDSTVVPVVLSGDELHNRRILARKFIKALGLPEDVLNTRQANNIVGRVGIEWLSVEIGTHAHRKLPVEELAGGTSLWEVLADGTKRSRDVIFLALVDEAQRVQGGTGSGSQFDSLNEMALNLADGNTDDLKVMTVFGGLSDTTAQLSKVGVSPRLAQGSCHLIDRLSDDDVRTLIASFLDDASFGLHKLSMPREDVIQGITLGSDCYPRHVQSYLRGLADECIESETYIDFGRAIERGQVYRLDFYNELIRNSRIEAIKEPLIEIARTTSSNGSFSKKDLKQLAIEQLNMAPADFQLEYEKAIHGGIMVESLESTAPDAPVSFSVPSMKTFFSTGLNREKTLDLLKSQSS